MQKYCLVLFCIRNTEWKWKWIMNVYRQDCSKFEIVWKLVCMYVCNRPWWTLELLAELTNWGILFILHLSFFSSGNFSWGQQWFFSLSVTYFCVVISSLYQSMHCEIECRLLHAKLQNVKSFTRTKIFNLDVTPRKVRRLRHF